MADTQNIRAGRHCAFALHAHLVFVTKYQQKVFNDAHLKRMEEIMCAVCEDFEVEMVDFNGENNHVHLLVNFPPKVALSKLVNSLKGVSSRRLRQEYPALLAGTTPVVRLVLRRVGRWGSAVDRPSVHRAAESSALARGSEYFSNRFTTGLKPDALRLDPVADGVRAPDVRRARARSRERRRQERALAVADFGGDRQHFLVAEARGVENDSAGLPPSGSSAEAV